MKSTLFLLMCLLLPVASLAQQDARRPAWLNGYHKDLTSSYIDVFQGSGATEDAARHVALQRIVDERSRATGRRFQLTEHQGSIVLDSQDELTVKCRIVDEYHRQQSGGGYEVFLLVQTARHPDYAFESVSVTDSYPVSARMLVPGWAQLHKGSTAKGLCVMGGFVAGGLGILLCENQRADYNSKMRQQPQFAQTYHTKANNWATARNICIGATAAVYAYNLIDAIAAKGARRVVVGRGGRGSLSLRPQAGPGGAAVSMTYNF